MLILLYLLEIPVGITQLIAAFIRTLIKLNKGEPLGYLKTYWIIVGIYFLVLLAMYIGYNYVSTNINYSDFSSYDTSGMLYWKGMISSSAIVWVGLAWFIAIWYWVKICSPKKAIQKDEA